MIDTIIVSGGNIQKDFALDFLKTRIKEQGRENIRLIAADKGLEFFLEAGIRPDMAVGDFDSLSKEGRTLLESMEDVQIRRLKPEKDDSDTQSAVTFAAAHGAGDIALLGCLGTRFDHMLANLGLLLWGKQNGVHISMYDRYNCISLVESGTLLKKEEQFGSFVSFFSLGGDVPGLTLEGFKYPLNRHHLTFSDSGLTVSNEITADTAGITFDSGNLVMIMSRD